MIKIKDLTTHKNLLKNLTISDLFFLIAYAIYLFFLTLKTTLFMKYISTPVYKGINVIVILLLFCSLIMTTKFGKRIILQGCTLVAVCIGTIVLYKHMMGRSELLPFLLILFCGRRFSFDKLARITVLIGGFTLLFIIVSSEIGLIPNYTSSIMTSQGLRVRQFLGFRYALYPPGILFNIISLDMYVHRRNPTFMRSAIWAGLAYLMYLKTNSRLSFILSLVAIIGILIIYRYVDLFERFPVIPFLMANSFLIFAGLSIYITLIYDSNVPWMFELNHSLESRLQLGHDGFNTYPVTLFGQDIIFVGNGLTSSGQMTVGIYNYIDCFYIHILLRYGIVFFVLVIGSYTALSYILWKNKNYFLMMLLTMLSGHAMIDDLILYLSFNSLWLAILPFLLNSHMDEHVLDKVNEILRKLLRKRKHIHVK